VVCYRCGRKGHKSTECKADTHVEGKAITPRGESPAPGQRSQQAGGGGGGSSRNTQYPQ
jgi:hypothetical protein